MTQFTNRSVFQIEFVCGSCGKLMPDSDSPTDGECSCNSPLFVDRNYRHFLLGADVVRDIHLVRHPAGALVDIPQRFVVHSPDGFEWGYGGSGPADLALNVLALFVPPQEAWRLHQDFKFAVIARIPRTGGVIAAEQVRSFIRAAWGES